MKPSKKLLQMGAMHEPPQTGSTAWQCAKYLCSLQQDAQGGLYSARQLWEAEITRSSDSGPAGRGPMQKHNQHHLSQVQT